VKKTYKLILFVLIFFSCSQDTHTIATGTVKDTVVGQPIDSVEIMLKRKTTIDWFGFGTGYRNVGLTYSNIYGEFYIDDHYTKQEDDDFLLYELLIGKAGYRSKSFELEENETNEFDVALRPWQTDYHTIVKGYFLEKNTDDPIEDVKVYLYQSINSIQDWNIVDSSTTDNTGYFYLEDYYERELSHETFYYKFDFHKDGYDHPRYTINVIVDGIKEVTLHLSPISG